MKSTPPRDCVLVVGAAHVDVIADYEPAAGRQAVDKPGAVHYAVGGTAYNLAINLGQEGVPVALMTVLRPSTYPSIWIRERLERAGVNGHWIDLDPDKPDSGFVAIRRARELETAVTATAVERHSFAAETIDAALASSRIVVLDCNLAPDQIDTFMERAHAAGKPVACAAVSDSKVSRLVTRAYKHLPFDLVALNEHELRAAGVAVLPADGRAASAVCALLGARRVVVTRGAEGHMLLGEAGDLKAWPAPVVGSVKSTTGAGDALLAAILARWYRRTLLDVDDALQTIVKVVGKVLGEPGATRGAIASEADLEHVSAWLSRQRGFRERWLTHETRLMAAGGLLIALLAWWFPRAPVTEPPVSPSAAAAARAASTAAAEAGRSASAASR